jgi:adenylate kinase family enzyme
MKQKRVFIIGTMGSGKTTLAKKIANKLKIKPNSLDDVYWTTKYTRKRNSAKRERIVKNIIKNKKWVIEGVFQSWVGEIAQKADLVIWLDLHPNILTWNILKRFVKNTLTGKEKERGTFYDNYKIVVHARKYRNGEHKNSYRGHREMIKKHRVKPIHITTLKQLRKLETRLKIK